VLIVPYAGHFADVGTRSMVAWNGAREASRAVSDALPMLKRSENVNVVSFESGKITLPADEVARKDMARYLERHGVKAKVSRTVLGELSAGDAILSRVTDLAADSIVMGAYGHSRVRERILGGATRIVLDHMTVPVLMSH
jgi:nucleotide-binding universal stress UspA family protein